MVPRPKNQETIVALGLTLLNIREIILSLSVADYCHGPEKDRDKPGEIWVFGKQVQNKEVYIKLKIAHVGNEKIAKCISFHAAERPLRYPNKHALEQNDD